MSKLYKFLYLISVASAMSLTSCQKESFAPGSEEGTVITVHATVEDVANASKTHIDGTRVYWNQEEQMKVVSFDSASPEASGKEGNSSSFAPSADYTTATFTVTVNNEAANTIAGVYPASAAKGLGASTNATEYKVELLASQSATASSYDPAAYVMITRPQTLPVENNEWTASYIRATALTRMEVSGLGDNINSVTITFPESQSAAGRRYFDLSTSTPGEVYYQPTNAITVSYAEPLAAGNTQNVWFTSWNVDVAVGETVTVKVESDTKVYTKTFTAKKAISLKENFLNIMPVNMEGAEAVSAIEPSGDGTIDNPYNVAAALKAIEESGNVTGVYAKGFITKIDEVSTQYGNATYYISDDVNGINSLYVYRGYYLDGARFTSEDQIQTGDEVIVFGDLKNYNGTYEFNTGSSICSIVSTVSNPSLTVDESSKTVSANAASVSFDYVARNLTEAVTATVAADDDNIVSKVSVDAQNSKVLVTLVPNTDEKEKTATIAISANGISVQACIIQESYSGSGETDEKQPGWLELPAYLGTEDYVNTLYAGSDRNYSYWYEVDWYSSMWIAYPLYADTIGSGRSDNWAANPQIPASEQINVWDGSYGVDVSGTIYSRGHQIPNGDRNGNSTMQRQTFYATNSTPQIQDRFNGGIWQQLENSIQSIASGKDTVYVVTGPTFKTVGGNEEVKWIQPKHDSKKAPVPNYYWKAVLKVKRSGGTVTDAMAVGFWFEHRQYTDKYENYAVSVDEIERLTGLDLFTNLPESVESKAETNSSWSSFRNF